MIELIPEGEVFVRPIVKPNDENPQEMVINTLLEYVPDNPKGDGSDVLFANFAKPCPPTCGE